MDSMSLEAHGVNIVITEQEHEHVYSTERNIHLCMDCAPDEHGMLTSDDCINREVRSYLVTLDPDEMWTQMFTVEATCMDEAATMAERTLAGLVQPYGATSDQRPNRPIRITD